MSTISIYSTLALVYTKDWKVFFSCKLPDRKYFGLWSHIVTVTATQLCHCSLKAVMHNRGMNGCLWLCVNKTLFIKIGSGPELLLDCSLLTPSVDHHITFLWQFSVACQSLELQQCKAATKSDCKLQDLWHLWKWGRIIAWVKLKPWTSENMAELDQWKRKK